MLITDDEDREREEAHVKKALQKCGYPNWAIQRKKETAKPKETKPKSSEEESVGRICIPYIPHTSERIAREFRKLGAEVIYLPTQKLKNILCPSSKDQVPDMDKAGVNYKVNLLCKKPIPEKENYVGETKQATKQRMYEHHVVHHKEATTSTAWIEEIQTTTNEQGLRRSQRNANKEKPNYRDMNNGPPMWLTPGNTAVSNHLAEDHEHEIEVTILGRERNGFRRGVKDAINIKRHKPTLNKNEQDRYKLSLIYDKLIKSDLMNETAT